MKTADITIPNIIARFNQFNKEYFNNELKTPNFRISTTKTVLGQCSVKKNIPTISISNYYDVEDVELNNTLIHEMIHLYQWQVYKKMSHLDTFKSKANEIYSLSNGLYSISRTSKRDAKKLSLDGQKRLEKRSVNAKKPIWVLCVERDRFAKETEYAWLVCVTEKYYEEVFKTGRFTRYPSIEIAGFLYDVPTTISSKFNLPTCRNTFRGKKAKWEDFCKLYEKDIVSKVTKAYKNDSRILFKPTNYFG